MDRDYSKKMLAKFKVISIHARLDICSYISKIKTVNKRGLMTLF